MYSNLRPTAIYGNRKDSYKSVAGNANIYPVKITMLTEKAYMPGDLGKRKQKNLPRLELENNNKSIWAYGGNKKEIIYNGVENFEKITLYTRIVNTSVTHDLWTQRLI